MLPYLLVPGTDPTAEGEQLGWHSTGFGFAEELLELALFSERCVATLKSSASLEVDFTPEVFFIPM